MFLMLAYSSTNYILKNIENCSIFDKKRKKIKKTTKNQQKPVLSEVERINQFSIKNTKNQPKIPDFHHK